MSKTVFLAGASGVVGVPLSKMLIEAGYTVYGTTRSQAKAERLSQSGIYNVADEDPRLDTSKFRHAFPEWSADFRF